MELNYTPLRHTPLVLDDLHKHHTKKKKRGGFDGVFFSLSIVTIMTLATIIYTILEKKFITGL